METADGPTRRRANDAGDQDATAEARTDHAVDFPREADMPGLSVVVPAYPPVVARVLLRILLGVRDNQS